MVRTRGAGIYHRGGGGGQGHRWAWIRGVTHSRGDAPCMGARARPRRALAPRTRCPRARRWSFWKPRLPAGPDA